MHLEAFLLLGVDEGTHDVGGEEVRGELDAAEFGVYGLRQRIDSQGLSKAGHTFQEDVAAAEKANEEVLHQVLLAYDDLAHFQGKEVYELALFLDSFVELTNVNRFHINY